jgi:hypothetical protein
MAEIKVNVSQDCIVNWVMDYPQGPATGVLICLGRDVSIVEPAQRGKPRTDYARTYCVIPEDTSEERAVEIFRANWREAKRTCGGSFDDAGIGDLSDRTVLLYDAPEYKRAALISWYEVNYPGVKVVFA